MTTTVFSLLDSPIGELLLTQMMANLEPRLLHELKNLLGQLMRGLTRSTRHCSDSLS